MKQPIQYVSLTLAMCFLAAAGCGQRQPPPYTGPSTASVTADDILNGTTILQIDIEIPRTGMRTLRNTEWGSGEERPKTRATVTEGGVVYRDVAIHLKGAAGSFRSIDDRPALTLNFDKHVAGQNFHGLNKISLNNSIQDPSYLSEKLCRELFLAAGVPVPRAGHALVRLNGRDLGLYVLLEGANKQFLKRHFEDAKGNLFDGGFVRDVTESLDVNCGENPEDRSGLTALLLAERETRQTRNLEPLEKALDVDRFLSMIALEVMIRHWDGYALNKNNWRVFHDRLAGKMVFIPHGIDQTFGTGEHQRVPPVFGTEPGSWQGRLAGTIMRTGEGRRRYRDRVKELYASAFQVERLNARIDEIQAGISPVLSSWDRSAARYQERHASSFKRRVLKRVQDLRAQLDSPPKPAEFSNAGVLKLTGWKPAATRTGEPSLRQRKDTRGNPILTVSAGGNLSSGSWRTRAMVPQGKYRLEGMLRVTGVTVEAGDPRGGAGLRISRGTTPQKLSGTTDWQLFTYEFEEEDIADIEFVCELRAINGEAAFDPASIRLVRLQ